MKKEEMIDQKLVKESGQVPLSGEQAADSSREAVNSSAAAVIERFMESRESYVRALETTIQVLSDKVGLHEKVESSIKQSLDELVTMQRLGNAISTATDQVSILDSLLDLTKQVMPVEESMIFEIGGARSAAKPFLEVCTDYMLKGCQHLLEEGILDWVTEQKKTTVVPDLNTSVGEAGEKFRRGTACAEERSHRSLHNSHGKNSQNFFGSRAYAFGNTCKSSCGRDRKFKEHRQAARCRGRIEKVTDANASSCKTGVAWRACRRNCPRNK